MKAHNGWDSRRVHHRYWKPWGREMHYRPGGIFTRGVVRRRGAEWEAFTGNGWHVGGFTTKYAAMIAVERMWAYWLDANRPVPSLATVGTGNSSGGEVVSVELDAISSPKKRKKK